MKKPSCHDELTIRHRFDRLCQMSLKGEAITYYGHMDYRREHEAMFSELSEKELNQLLWMNTEWKTAILQCMDMTLR